MCGVISLLILRGPGGEKKYFSKKSFTGFHSHPPPHQYLREIREIRLTSFVLGLDHSDVAAAVMAPFYDGFNPKFELHSDDIAGIRRLYPLREGTTGATESSLLTDESSTDLSSTATSAARPPFRTRYSSPRTTTSSSHTISFARDDKTTASATITSKATPKTPVTTTAVTVVTSSHDSSSGNNVDGPETLDDEILTTSAALPNSTTVTSVTRAVTTVTAAVPTTSSGALLNITSTAAPATDIISLRNSTDSPDLCNESFVIDAITTSDGAGYLFSGNRRLGCLLPHLAVQLTSGCCCRRLLLDNQRHGRGPPSG